KNACDQGCASELGQPDASTPPTPPPQKDSGAPDSHAPDSAPPVDAAKEAEAGPDSTIQECSFMCDETTPDVHDCYTDSSMISVCMGRCNSGSTQATRTTFIQCVQSLSPAPSPAMCSAYFSNCYGPFTQ